MGRLAYRTAESEITRRVYLNKGSFKVIVDCREEIHMRYKKGMMMLVAALLLTNLFVLTAFASNTGNVAGAIEGSWRAASSQIKTVVNNVIFPAIDLVLAILFFVKVGTSYMDYRKHGQLEWAPAAILFAGLVFTMTAPLYVWQIIGI